MVLRARALGLLHVAPSHESQGAPAQRMQGTELVLLRPWFKSLLYVGEGGLSPVFLSLPHLCIVMSNHSVSGQV